jgi:hypothetical protein
MDKSILLYKNKKIFWEEVTLTVGFCKKNMKERTAFPSFRKKIGGFQFASVLVRTRRPIPKKLLALMK